MVRGGMGQTGTCGNADFAISDEREQRDGAWCASGADVWAGHGTPSCCCSFHSVPVVPLLPQRPATFPGRDPARVYTRVTDEETRCRIATSPRVDHPGVGRPGYSLLGEVPLVTTLNPLPAGQVVDPGVH